MKKAFLIWLMKTRFYSWLLLKVIPFVRFTTYYTTLRGEKYHVAYDRLEVGHILLAVDKRKATSLLIPGVMTHAALALWTNRLNQYLSGPLRFEVAEMTHHDFTRSFFFDICKEADRVVILRCLDWDGPHIERVCAAAMSLQNAKYDIAFTLGVDALYCSELVYQADKIAGGKLKVDLSDIAGLGRPYISPDGLACGDNVQCVWDTDGEWTGLLGPQIKKLIDGGSK